MHKIGTKITLTIVLCTTIISFLVGAVGLYQSNRLMNEQARNQLLSQTQSIAYQFNSKLQSIELSINLLSNEIIYLVDVEKLKTDPTYSLQFEEQIAPMIKTHGEETEDAVGSYFFFDSNLTKQLVYTWYADTQGDGRLEKQTSYSLKDFDAEIPSMQWYYKPIAEGKGIWSDIYTDMHTNMEMISYTKPVYKDGILIGVIGMDIEFEELHQIVSNIKVYKTGYATLLNKDYDFLIHPVYTQRDNLASIDNQNLIPVVKAMEKNESPIIEYTLEGIKKIGGYIHLPSGYIIFIDVPQKEVFEKLLLLRNLILTITLVGAVISTLLSIYVSKIITKPILKVTEFLNTTSSFDLIHTQEDLKELSSYKGEAQTMGRALMKLRKALEEMACFLTSTSKKISTSSEGLVESTNKAAISTEEISKAIEQLAVGASEQAKNTEQGLQKLIHLSEKMNRVAESSNIMKCATKKTFEINKKSTSSVKNTKEKMLESNSISKEVEKAVLLLGEKSSSIGKITSVIEAIASQINLLSLNASIEAARAGEHGKGFGVVADEIKKLAQQTSFSVKEIEDLITELQGEIQGTTDKMNIADLILQQLTLAIEETEQDFEILTTSIEDTANHISILIKNIQDIEKDKDGVIADIQDISAVSEESAAAIQQISASLQEELAMIENLSRTADDLNHIINELNQNVNTFRVSKST